MYSPNRLQPNSLLKTAPYSVFSRFINENLEEYEITISAMLVHNTRSSVIFVYFLILITFKHT